MRTYKIAEEIPEIVCGLCLVYSICIRSIEHVYSLHRTLGSADFWSQPMTLLPTLGLNLSAGLAATLSKQRHAVIFLFSYHAARALLSRKAALCKELS